ncbi:MAG: D-alanyl-D-alanine carboxypeptidase [Rhizobiales bacterium 65-79]|jgi:D-alanyl-D-alanine carboxypeptidase|nr:D-alanyl-D-alanine carboxypeptidase [Hyphomicrobiales bacterium]OJU00480.1 MAG: D-alanyl-D-alanine carboxypeptidase [Rhizobiales bacterium 65-79]
MRQLLSGIFSVALLVLASPAISPALAGPSLLFDVNDSRVLEHQDAFARWYPASLTKLMTAYVAFKAIGAGEVTLQSPIRMTKNSASQPPSKMGFKPGDVMTLDNALKMMITHSANDIAMAVGENVGGSEEAFVDRMNAEARRLGMSGTHYANPNGLFSPDNYTTARDQAVLVTAIRKEYPQYLSYFNIEAIGIGKKVIPNINALIGRFDGADGMKTGFICESGFNFIGSATRQGRTLAAIVLGAGSITERAAQTAALLAQGFGTNEPADAPMLASMPVDGNGVGEATNMRQALCSKEARKRKRQKLADAGGEDDEEQAPLVMGSPYLHKLDHPRTVVMVGLGGATGPGGLPEEPEYADVPIPTPRPDYTPPAKSTKPAAKAQSASVR